MTKELFDVCLTGKLLTGHNRREVCVNLAQLMETSISRADELLTQSSCVKRNVDRATADYYRKVLEETGADVFVRSLPALTLAPTQPIDIEKTPVLQPDQPFDAEATPVLEDDEAPPSTIVAPPAPVHYGAGRLLKWTGVGLMAIAAGAAGVLLLPVHL